MYETKNVRIAKLCWSNTVVSDDRLQHSVSPFSSIKAWVRTHPLNLLSLDRLVPTHDDMHRCAMFLPPLLLLLLLLLCCLLLVVLRGHMLFLSDLEHMHGLRTCTL